MYQWVYICTSEKWSFLDERVTDMTHSSLFLATLIIWWESADYLTLLCIVFVFLSLSQMVFRVRHVAWFIDTWSLPSSLWWRQLAWCLLALYFTHTSHLVFVQKIKIHVQASLCCWGNDLSLVWFWARPVGLWEVIVADRNALDEISSVLARMWRTSVVPTSVGYRTGNHHR